MVTAVYPGSFDPATYGHLDVIRRASVSFDRVVVGVLQNSAKSPLFSVEERVNILEKATKDIPNAPDVDTVFLTTTLEYAYVSSTIMKEVARFGGDLSSFAPPEIIQALCKKMQEEKEKNKENIL